MRWLLLAVLVAGCAGNPGEEIVQSDEELAGAKAPNVGFTGTSNKVGAFITCDEAPLLYFPTGTKLVVGKDYPAGTKLEKGRAVLVQRAPGTHHSHVWVDADLYGKAASCRIAATARSTAARFTSNTTRRRRTRRMVASAEAG